LCTSLAGGQFHQHFWCQSRAAFALKIFDALIETAFGKNESKYGAHRKSFGFKRAPNFSRNVGETEEVFLVMCNPSVNEL
jgi:hypothetical protein